MQWITPKLGPSLDNLQNTNDKEVFLKALRASEFKVGQIGM